jgi:ribosomal protein S18 acetylase RimI-like enzyme
LASDLRHVEPGVGLANLVLVVDPAGYIGESTAREVSHAESRRLLQVELDACPVPAMLGSVCASVTERPQQPPDWWRLSTPLSVVTARQDGKLIGLARLIGDGQTIVYLQDILVAPDHQRRGIGRELFQRIFAPLGDVRQKVLITDDEPSQRAFYESMGFTETGNLDHTVRTFVRFG